MNLLKATWYSKYKIFSLLFYFSFVTLNADQKHFVIIVCSYNNAQWYQKNLDSLLNQNYDNYQILYIDDYSPDGTGQLVANYIHKHDRADKVTLIQNNVRHYKLYNLYHAIHDLCQNDEIIVEVDGDDWLLHENVLTLLNEIYQKDVWLTYGGFTCWPKTFKKLVSKDIPIDVIERNQLRSFFHDGYIFMALRSFYAGLFKQIHQEDLLHNNQFLTRASDVATMLPMFEMAGTRFYHIKKPVYLYNTDTGLNDYTVDLQKQRALCKFIENKTPYFPFDKAPF